MYVCFHWMSLIFRMPDRCLTWPEGGFGGAWWTPGRANGGLRSAFIQTTRRTNSKKKGHLVSQRRQTLHSGDVRPGRRQPSLLLSPQRYVTVHWVWISLHSSSKKSLSWLMFYVSFRVFQEVRYSLYLIFSIFNTGGVSLKPLSKRTYRLKYQVCRH